MSPPHPLSHSPCLHIRPVRAREDGIVYSRADAVGVAGSFLGRVAQGLFDHAVAQARYGVSIFWIRPGLLVGESVEDFIAYWQIKRDGSRRGIVEVVP